MRIDGHADGWVLRDGSRTSDVGRLTLEAIGLIVSPQAFGILGGMLSVRVWFSVLASDIRRQTSDYSTHYSITNRFGEPKS